MLSNLMVLLNINATAIMYFHYSLVCYSCMIVIIFEMRVEKDYSFLNIANIQNLIVDQTFLFHLI